MICALSLNPCLDKSARAPALAWDAPNRIRVERADLGSKGVNVARVIRALGGEGMLISLDDEAGAVAAAMTAEGIPGRFLPRAGEIRINLKIWDEADRRVVEINEQGPEITAADLDRVEEALLSLCQPGGWAVLSGSLPPGAGTDTYARLCRKLKEQGCQVAVDCDGEALRLALIESPALIKPNAWEFAALTGADAGDGRAAVAACRALLARGVGAVCLSRGAEGALLVTKSGAWACPAAEVPMRGSQGAGDTLLAALILSLVRGMPEPEALRFASAAAGASVLRPGTLLCRREDAERLLLSMPPARACF